MIAILTLKMNVCFKTHTAKLIVNHERYHEDMMIKPTMEHVNFPDTEPFHHQGKSLTELIETLFIYANKDVLAVILPTEEDDLAACMNALTCVNIDINPTINEPADLLPYVGGLTIQAVQQMADTVGRVHWTDYVDDFANFELPTLDLVKAHMSAHDAGLDDYRNYVKGLPLMSVMS